MEYPQCVYTVSYESALACPWDCIKTSGMQYSVCSGKGICVADPNAGKSKCLCDDYWSGDFCDVESPYDVDKVSSSHGEMITAVVVCIVLLVIAIGVSLYLCHRIRFKEEQVAGVHGQYARGMLDDQVGVHADDGTSMGIVSGQSQFDPNISVDPTVQNEIAQQHAKDVELQHGDENDDVTSGGADTVNDETNIDGGDEQGGADDVDADAEADADGNVDQDAAGNERVEEDLLGAET